MWLCLRILDVDLKQRKVKREIPPKINQHQQILCCSHNYNKTVTKCFMAKVGFVKWIAIVIYFLSLKNILQLFGMPIVLHL